MLAANRPEVSVIIPAYQREDEIGRAVDSVLAQHSVDFELLVVDDASTDHTGDIVASYADDRVRLLRHAENRGGSEARNTGIAAARGRYIAFLDSDDEWLPGKLGRNLDVVRELPEQGRWLLFNRLRIVTELGTSLSDGTGPRAGESVAEYLFIRRGNIQTSGTLLPASLAQRVRFDGSLKRLQDWDFYLRVERAGARFVFQPDVLTVHHAMSGANRISTQLDPDFLHEWILARRDLISPRAYRGYLANKLAPEEIQCGRRLSGLLHLVPGIAAGVVPRRYATIELLRLGLPAWLFTLLVQTARRARR